MFDMFSGDASHANWGSRRLFFRPAMGCLPSARHCSHVCGYLKSNLPFLPGGNCVRGMVRSHTWHVNGLGWSLPSARHCSHVCGFLKSNWPFLPGRNCVRGMVRSHTWHVNGFAAASLDLCSFNCRYPVGCPLGAFRLTPRWRPKRARLVARRSI